MKLSLAVIAVATGSAAAYAPSSFSGSALKATASNAGSMKMVTGMGVNGFG
eukprot:CAMPEP_0118706472 /NCGR_PEP_ID=MMETSP0800-20121206/20578_1 /TAXON_ID=210618 ORGANISM="Striatella unipunctata, Strain CCMP2910" /NCGR_SAMPLE_ID=MMETSP0800 /ASSEMBLY_ACC=CAM_ASM_000638 /LENGTH=50 /DNA_ID=CAMNT_0006609013 /DNA_START=53 /DNA_END=201 /DNA_ORIENTATION=+